MLGRRRLLMEGLDSISLNYNPLDSDEATLVASRKSAAAHNKSVDGQQKRINVFLAIGAFLIVFTNFLIIFSGKSMATIANEQGADVLAKSRLVAVWAMSNCADFVWPILCGVAVTIFAWAMVYLDSERPGFSPPSPFSPKKKYGYRTYNERTCHLNYAMSLACGMVVSSLVYFSDHQLDL